MAIFDRKKKGNNQDQEQIDQTSYLPRGQGGGGRRGETATTAKQATAVIPWKKTWGKELEEIAIVTMVDTKKRSLDNSKATGSRPRNPRQSDGRRRTTEDLTRRTTQDLWSTRQSRERNRQQKKAGFNGGNKIGKVRKWVQWKKATGTRLEKEREDDTSKKDQSSAEPTIG
jgi:hypothetical protein